MATDSQLKVGIILGSTRPKRIGEAVAKWVHGIATARGDAEYVYLDVADQQLPLLDEPIPASQGKYSQGHTKAWAEKIAACDAFVFITPEYNHSTSGALKNAIDFLFKEWNDKSAGFVSYGSAGGVRAVEHLRQIMAELMIADVRAQVALSLHTDFEHYSRFTPAAHHEKSVNAMLDQVLAWGGALRGVRSTELRTKG